MQWVESFADIVSFVSWQLLWVGAVLLLYEGAKGLPTEGIGRRAVAKVIGGAITCLVVGAFNLHMYSLTSKLVENFERDKTRHTQVPETWGRDQSPQDRTKNSTSLASVAFIASGQLLKYVNESGEWTQFSPGAKDIEARETTLTTHADLSALSDSYFQAALRWFGSGALAAVVGWQIGRRRGKKAG